MFWSNLHPAVFWAIAIPCVFLLLYGLSAIIGRFQK